MKLTVNIKSAGADFADPDTGYIAVADAVTNIADMIRDGHTSGKVRDINGNTYGSWSYVKDAPTDED